MEIVLRSHYHVILINLIILNFVKVTVHFYDAKGQVIADSSCCYTDPTNIDPGHTSTFDSFAVANEISGEPVSYRLSYDWNK